MISKWLECAVRWIEPVKLLKIQKYIHITYTYTYLCQSSYDPSRDGSDSPRFPRAGSTDHSMLTPLICNISKTDWHSCVCVWVCVSLWHPFRAWAWVLCIHVCSCRQVFAELRASPQRERDREGKKDGEKEGERGRASWETEPEMCVSNCKHVRTAAQCGINFR